MKSITINFLSLLLTLSIAQAQETETPETETKAKLRPFQFSMVPGLGTGGEAKEGYTNQFSVNLIGGYQHSLDGTEFGVFNINTQHVNGAEFAAFSNLVGGDIKGAQFSGFMNLTKGHLNGVQVASFVNVLGKDVTGVQLAGFVNVADSIKGVQLAGFTNVATKGVNGGQLAGFVNIADSIKGVQLAGFTNVATKGVNGSQVAGFVNVADSVKGVQLAGYTNVATKGVNGGQVSGLVNVAKDVSGVQVATFLNVGRKVQGTQLALINIADTISNGVAIGLINIIKHGKHELAIENNDVIDMSLAFRSGTDRLYSVLFAGMEAKSDYTWSYGAGFGTQFKLKNQWNNSVELTTQTINTKRNHHQTMNLLNRLSWNIGYQMSQNLSFSAGPALNVYITEVTKNETDGNAIDRGNFYNKNFSGTNVKMWLGYNLSIKF